MKSIFKKILYVFVTAIFMASPCIAAPEDSDQSQVPIQGIQNIQEVKNIQLQPLSESEHMDVQTQNADDESLQTKPSNGDIEKNSSQEPFDKSNLAKEIMPETKSELFRVAMMFLKVMLAVILCSIVIYLILLFVKKTYIPQNTEQKQTPEPKEDLKSPLCENEALKTFLSQTKNH